MIAKTAIENYLNRNLVDSSSIKLFTEEQLDSIIDQLNPKPVFNLKPYKHQKATFLLCLKYGFYLPLLDMGLGKSSIALNLFRQKRNEWLQFNPQNSHLFNMLVLVPNIGNLATWKNQVKTHTPEFSIQVLDGKGEKERWEQIYSDNPILVCTYQGLVSLLTDSVKAKKGKKNKWIVNEEKVDALIDRFAFCCFDEATAFGNHLSLTYKICKRISWASDFAIGMTGTPFGNDPHSLWPMFDVIDRGETFGELGLFREAFFKKKKNYFSGFDEWVFDKSKKKALSQMMRHRSIRYNKNECLDLPPKIYIKRPIPASQESLIYYNKLIEQLIASKDDFEVRENIYHKMRYLTAGYIKVKTDKDSYNEIVLDSNPKLDALIADIKEIPNEDKIVIFHHYLRTGEIIEERLKKEKIRFVTCNSQTKDVTESLEKFADDPKMRIMLSSSAGAMGSNLQNAHYVMFFESSSDPKIREQEEGRCHRIGQTEKVIYFDYFVEGTVDEKILKCLAEGKNLFTSVVESKEFLLDKQKIL
jgi:SNF2 family DNA or RNA helicase